MLKPVMTMMPRNVTGITGYVQVVNGVTVTVSAQKGGVVVRSTQPNANGQFLLSPITPDPGYDIVFTAAGRQTSVIAGVPAELDKTTTVSTANNVVTMPPSSATTAVSGTVSPAEAVTAGASVRALQTIGNLVEVAHANVISAGTYSLALSQIAPRLMTYSPSPANPLPFVDVAASATKFKLEASASGYKTSPQKDITLSGTTMTGQDFTLTK
jgi:hypothetical protein